MHYFNQHSRNWFIKLKNSLCLVLHLKSTAYLTINHPILIRKKKFASLSRKICHGINPIHMGTMWSQIITRNRIVFRVMLVALGTLYVEQRYRQEWRHHQFQMKLLLLPMRCYKYGYWRCGSLNLLNFSFLFFFGLLSTAIFFK